MSFQGTDAFVNAYIDALQFILGDKPAELERMKTWVRGELEELPEMSDGFQKHVPLMPPPSVTPSQRARRDGLLQLLQRLQSLN